MKMSKELFNQIEVSIDLIDHKELRDMYREGNFPRADLVKDLNKRYRWDLYWEIIMLDRSSNNGISDIANAVRDEDLNSNHIDTALRKIVKPL